jgi:hypothetical protein
MVKILDNFLEPDIHEQLGKSIIKINKWQISSIDYEPEHYENFNKPQPKNNSQMVHTFYFEPDAILDKDTIGIVHPILSIIHPFVIWRIKANLQYRTHKVDKNNYHTDMGEMLSVKRKKLWTTGIYYVSSNNGYTEFEDGTIVESVGNRFIEFPADTHHRGTSCSDEEYRITINFNYFRDK